MGRHAADEGIAGPALDLLDLAVLAVDDRERIIFANRAAGDLLNEGLVLVWRDGSLAGRDGRLQKQLEAMLDYAFRGERAAATLSCPRDRARLYAVVIPLTRRAGSLHHNGARLALLYLVDGRRALKWSSDLLTQVLGLTPAEARLAHALMSGKTLTEHAAMAQVAVSTVRSQLKHILVKTGTHRQIELVRLLARLPAIR